MVTTARFQALALAFDDASTAPHRDRLAFRTPQRIYATLASDGASANLKLSPEQQEVLVTSRPDAFAPVPGGWGRQGWTTVTLAAADEASVKDGLDGAHAIAAQKRPGRSVNKAPTQKAPKKR